MADQIIHDSNTVVDSSGFVSNSALRNSGVTAGAYNNSKTNLASITVDVKGRVTSATNTTTKLSSIFTSAVPDTTIQCSDL